MMGSAATMSVCLSPCTVPGLGSSFILGENEIEMGLGIHGEAGAHRCQVLCVVMYACRGWDCVVMYAWRGWGSSLCVVMYAWRGWGSSLYVVMYAWRGWGSSLCVVMYACRGWGSSL